MHSQWMNKISTLVRWAVLLREFLAQRVSNSCSRTCNVQFNGKITNDTVNVHLTECTTHTHTYTKHNRITNRIQHFHSNLNEILYLYFRELHNSKIENPLKSIVNFCLLFVLVNHWWRAHIAHLLLHSKYVCTHWQQYWS